MGSGVNASSAPQDDSPAPVFGGGNQSETADPSAPPGAGGHSLAPLDPATAGALVERAWAEDSQDVASFQDLMRSPHGLDVLDQLPPTHSARAGLKVKCHHVGEDGRARLVHRDWSYDLPTEERIGGLVNAGTLPAGEYRVTLWRGRQSLPRIVMDISAPLTPGGNQDGDRGIMLELLRAITGGRPLLDVGRRGQASEDAADLAARMDRLEDAVSGLNDLVAGAVTALSDKDGAAGGLADLVPAFVAAMQGGNPANGNGNGAPLAPEASPRFRGGAEDLTR